MGTAILWRRPSPTISTGSANPWCELELRQPPAIFRFFCDPFSTGMCIICLPAYKKSYTACIWLIPARHGMCRRRSCRFVAGGALKNRNGNPVWTAPSSEQLLSRLHYAWARSQARRTRVDTITSSSGRTRLPRLVISLTPFSQVGSGFPGVPLLAREPGTVSPLQSAKVLFLNQFGFRYMR